VFKNLGIGGSDGKLNESLIQAYADHLKESLPPDLFKKAFEFKRTCLLGLGGGSSFAFFIRLCLCCVGWLFCWLLVLSDVVCSCC
jgi:hypothetical protein